MVIPSTVYTPCSAPNYIRKRIYTYIFFEIFFAIGFGRTYLDHKKDPEPAEDDEDAEDEGEGDHGDQVEEGGQVQVQVAPQHNVGDQGGTLSTFFSLRFIF